MKPLLCLFKPTAQTAQKLSYLLVFLTFDLILFGAFTRLTDSGLGCPDWPGCYGSLSPLGAKTHIDAAQTLMPTGPVTHIKAWIEMLHRYFATSVGALITLRLIWSIQLKQPKTLPLLTFIWVCVQGAFGALTVTMKLQPLIVTSHLMGGLILLMLLSAQLQNNTTPHQARLRLSQPTHQGASNLPRLRLWITLTLLATWLQIALGGWVSTNYAVLACTEFPTCLSGAWFPATLADWQAGFVLWRDLGSVHFSALTAIHLTHRIGALLVLGCMIALFIQLKPHAALRRLKLALMLILTLQIITGISNAIFDWPLAAALLHTGGAAALIFVLTRLWTLTSTEKMAS